MKVVKKKLTDLKRPEKNVRMHTDKQIEEFKRSVEMFGQIRPIVIDENNVMLAGNGLYETLCALDYKEADCYVVTGLSENEKKKLMLADNKVFDLGCDDMKAFDEILAELGDDLDIPGYDEDLLQAILAEPEDVDEMMSDYGIVPEEQKEKIESNQGIYDNPPEAKPLQSVENHEEEVVDTRRSVICPHCGETIWL